MFPTINHLNDLLPFVQNNKQIRMLPDVLTGHIIVSYMIQDEDTFAGEHEHFEREARGITFHPDGRIAARTLHKFFNIGQRDDVQPEALHWPSVTRIMEKRDGSMVTPVLMEDGSIVCKTKKTFTSKEAIEATKFLNGDAVKVEWCRKWLQNGYTPTFEWTSPRFPIVLIYEKDELTLLHIRENVQGTYINLDKGPQFGVDPVELMPFPIVENVMDQFIGEGVPANLVSWKKLEQYALTAEGVEGVVIQFGQEMVKLKTKWYCELHRSVTFTRWRDIARSVVADQSDDLKGAFALTGRSIEPILKVEHTIKTMIDLVKSDVEWIAQFGIGNGKTAKEMALLNKEHQYFGLIMRMFRGQGIDWMDWYAKNRLENDFGLEVVGDDA